MRILSPTSPALCYGNPCGPYNGSFGAPILDIPLSAQCAEEMQGFMSAPRLLTYGHKIEKGDGSINFREKRGQVLFFASFINRET